MFNRFFLGYAYLPTEMSLYSLSHDRGILLKYHTVTVFIQYTKTTNWRQCMHLQSYMYAFTKLQLKKLTVCVRARMRACVYHILA